MLKMKLQTLIVGFFLLTNTIYAVDGNQILQQKIDSLETAMLKIKNERGAQSFIPKSLEMGKGFYFSSKSGSEYIFNLEAGYNWGAVDEDKINDKDMFLGNRRDFRYGLSGGFQYFQDIPVFKNNTTFYKSTGYGIFGKINVGTPVMMNFISMSFHLKPMYLIPAKDNDHNITKNRMALGYGYDLEFWLTQSKSATIGFTDETDNLAWDKRNDSILPSKIRLTFGFKTFF